MDARPSQEFQNRGFINKNKLDSYEQSLQLLQQQASLYVDPNQIPVQLKLDIRTLSSEVERLRALKMDTNSD